LYSYENNGLFIKSNFKKNIKPIDDNEIYSSGIFSIYFKLFNNKIIQFKINIDEIEVDFADINYNVIFSEKYISENFANNIDKNSIEKKVINFLEDITQKQIIESDEYGEYLKTFVV
jgi:hypothetical protein